jgi:tRNA U34 5-methylaminomethyl-2-thiouridine-forming methyltransferase MnmC
MVNKIQGSLGLYTWQETEDGSFTLYSDYFQENCHSVAGAGAETLYNYVEGCQVINRLKQRGNIHIFEIGFATGLGLSTTLEAVSNQNIPDYFIQFTSCELDQKLTEFSLEKLQDQGLVMNYHWEEKENFFQGELSQNRGCFTVIIGDIRRELEKWKNSPHFKIVDAIYQDAFSPKRNPTLWTYQWFAQLKSIGHKETILSTYSSTKAVWKAMIKAGWKVEMVKGYGAKKLSTRAYLDPHFKVAPELEILLERSPMDALSDN